MSDSRMAGHRITVRFPEELLKRLRAASRRSGKPESELVRHAVEQHLEAEDEQPSAYDHAKRMGLIGAVKGAPADLASNKKHLEGFGTR